MAAACVSGAKRSNDDVDAIESKVRRTEAAANGHATKSSETSDVAAEDAVSVELALAAAKKKALADFKQAALARLLGSDADDIDCGVGTVEETPTVGVDKAGETLKLAEDSPELSDDGETSPVAPTAEAIEGVEEWDPATGLIITTPMDIEALLKAEVTGPPDDNAGNKEIEADNKDEDQEMEFGVDFSIGDFLRKQSESVVGQFLSSGSSISASNVGVVASAAPVLERRDPTARRRPGEAHALTKHTGSEEAKAEPFISSTGKVVGREMAKSVSGGFCSYGRGDASTGVEFNTNAQRKELERKQRDQELRQRFRNAEQQLRDQKSQQELQQQPVQAAAKSFAKVYARGQAPPRMPAAPLDGQQWDAPTLPDWQKQPAVRPVMAPKFKAAPKATGKLPAPRAVGMQAAPKAVGMQNAPKASTAFLRSGVGW